MITAFDWASEIGERKANAGYDRAINFDSVHEFWMFKKQKWAQFKAR
jgi:hypothetical protein